jgi:hypothetical protein
MVAIQAACEAVGSANCRGRLCKQLRLDEIKIISKVCKMKVCTNVVSGSHSMGEVNGDGFGQTHGAASQSIEC